MKIALGVLVAFGIVWFVRFCVDFARAYKHTKWRSELPKDISLKEFRVRSGDIEVEVTRGDHSFLVVLNGAERLALQEVVLAAFKRSQITFREKPE
jgi:hypothetical protein